ncbi:hypothetical protein Y032_0311g2150 [Ancylostoma ceylanicum]|nr:hypothetical protein Y032_0311g2150 [Ancylostoma ceylanicum]
MGYFKRWKEAGDTLFMTHDYFYGVEFQIIRVRCPAVKHFFIDDSSYVLLNDDCVILGGTADKNCWNTAVNPETAQRILHANQENVPALKSCEVISHHVGLRPGRSDVRLELERRLISGKKVSIVHNYGHGGSGVTLFWGCALDAVSLVWKALKENDTAKL